MNANELADELYDLDVQASQQSLNDWAEQAATMLRQQQAENEELKAVMRSFFEDFLNVREESDSGRVFAPVTIGCCRVMMMEPLYEVLSKMRTLSGAKKASEK